MITGELPFRGNELADIIVKVCAEGDPAQSSGPHPSIDALLRWLSIEIRRSDSTIDDRGIGRQARRQRLARARSDHRSNTAISERRRSGGSNRCRDRVTRAGGQDGGMGSAPRAGAPILCRPSGHHAPRCRGVVHYVCPSGVDISTRTTSRDSRDSLAGPRCGRRNDRSILHVWGIAGGVLEYPFGDLARCRAREQARRRELERIRFGGRGRAAGAVDRSDHHQLCLEHAGGPERIRDRNPTRGDCVASIAARSECPAGHSWWESFAHASDETHCADERQ